MRKRCLIQFFYGALKCLPSQVINLARHLCTVVKITRESGSGKRKSNKICLIATAYCERPTHETSPLVCTATCLPM